jgi:hypothetical protein
MNGSMRRSAAAGLRALSVSFSARHRACNKETISYKWLGRIRTASGSAGRSRYAPIL